MIGENWRSKLKATFLQKTKKEEIHKTLRGLNIKVKREVVLTFGKEKNDRIPGRLMEGEENKLLIEYIPLRSY